MKHGPVRLTAHPLQRVGAFALAELADKEDPHDLTDADFAVATERMTDDLLATARLDSAKEPGGFWLGASYLLWPNSPMNPTSRKQQSVSEREDRIRAWRSYAPDDPPGAPCALCGEPACGFYGKVDVPLRRSTAYRNTTAPGHEGMALCPGCLASFHALPYGCEIRGGRASLLHSWDDRFLRDVVGKQAARMAEEGFAGKGPGGSALPYAREVEALSGLREYETSLDAAVDLYVFSNSNRDQSLEVQSLEQPLAEWLRKSMRGRRRQEFKCLVRAHRTEKVPGISLLARNAFQEPRRIVGRAVSYAAARAVKEDAVPAEATKLARLCTSFSTEVLGVEERDMQAVRELGGRIAALLVDGQPSRGTLKNYERLHRQSRSLQKWLKRQGINWIANRGETSTLVTPEQWRLLFEPDSGGWFFQDLLLMCVLDSLAGRGFALSPEPPGDADSEDDSLFNDEEKES